MTLNGSISRLVPVGQLGHVEPECVFDISKDAESKNERHFQPVRTLGL